MHESWSASQHDDNQGAVRSKVVRGLPWTIVDGWGGLAIQFAVFVVLVNAIEPVDVGLVALALVFSGFAQLFVDQGLGDALIQRAAISKRHFDSAFWVAMLTGVGAALVAVAAAPSLGALLDEPRLVPIIQVLSIAFPLASLSSIPVGLLRREMAFKSLAVRTLVANVGGAFVGVALVYVGAGPWALVGHHLAVASVASVTVWLASPWKPSLRMPSPLAIRDLLPFGAKVVGADVLAYVSRNADNLLIGVLLGAGPLGYYAVGFRILSASSSLVIRVIRWLALPALSRLQGDRDRMRRAYLELVHATALLVIPGYLALSLTASEMVPVLFGEQWMPSASIAAALFLVGPALTMQALAGPFLNAAGHPGLVFVIRLVDAAVRLGAFAIAVQYGILAVAIAYTATSYALMPLVLYLVRARGGPSWVDYLVRLRGVAVGTTAMVIAVTLTKVVTTDISAGALLALELTAGAAAFGIVIFVIERQFIRRLVTAWLPGRTS
jgi:PST family polysaccharide transporter